MKQLIVINSTGRHRKVISDYSGAKTIKALTKRQLINSISTNMMRQKMDPILDRKTGLRTGGGFDYDVKSDGQKLRREGSINLQNQMWP